jgi:hypothetical protein
MLPEQQPQVDHRAVLAVSCPEGCALAQACGWDLVHHDWGERQGAPECAPECPPERPSTGTGRLARLVDIVRAAARCIRTMLRVSVALHAAARRHTLGHAPTLRP